MSATPPPRLRPASAADVPRLTELVQAAYGHYVERIGGRPRPMTDDYAEVVRSHRVTVAERGGEIVGLIVTRVDDEGFVVDNVAVDPAHQGTGAGRALLELAETEALAAGFDSIYLYTHEAMSENLALYKRIGYVEYDRRRHGEAGLVYLRKRLGDDAVLPDWPQRTIAVLATVDDGPHAIPVSAPVRAGDRRILLSLHRSRESLGRLREHPAVALTVLAAGNVAFTARGRAAVVEESMAVSPDYAVVAIEVEHIDDHCQPEFVVEGGVDRRWLDEGQRDALGERVRALRSGAF